MMFHTFKSDISDLEVPEKFTFPFYYTPHPLAIAASESLQEYLRQQSDFEHNFGLEKEQDGLVIGKMFGVLVVKNREGDLGYLQAFSGKLAERNHHSGFVPPVFDMLSEKGFFKKEEAILNALNQQIEDLENQQGYKDALEQLTALENDAKDNIDIERKKVKEGKKNRKKIRAEQKDLASEQYEELLEKLKNESIKSNYALRDTMKYWHKRLEQATQAVKVYSDQIIQLKNERRSKSGLLQDRLFRNYSFLNADGKSAHLLELFEDSLTGRPPAGAGECAAPKLLQYAFSNGYEPVALAEFWWGASPSAEVRQNKTYYPACHGKCKPILTHMLSASNVDENPMLRNPSPSLEITTIFEDDEIVVINKPAELLSVPGKHVKDSVQTRMEDKYHKIFKPLIVHRLDMSTSGLMILAKSAATHKFLQRQFITRKVHKRYVALLDGVLNRDSGMIELPLRVDLDDRPRQLVCYEYGKMATTLWKTIGIEQNKTRVHFFPKTGRTHQLRVHAAHSKGLHLPILGDDLYGRKGARLHLHAEELIIIHPTTREKQEFHSPVPF